MTNNKHKNILFVHNIYLLKGGEDAVVKNEIASLQKNNITVFYRQFNNSSNNKIKLFFLPVNIFFNFASFVEIFFIVKFRKISLVHFHNIFYQASPSVIWAAKMAGATTVVTIHNYRLFCLNATLFRDGKICTDCHTNQHFKKGIQEKCFKTSTIFSLALAWSTTLHRKIGTWQNKVDKFIVINKLTEQLLLDRKIKQNKVIFKPNFLFDSGYNDYTSRGNYYLYIGRLTEEKGIRHLVQAFEQLSQKLIIAGDGDLAEFVKDYCSEKIVYKGLQNKQEIKNLLLHCKALIFSSLWMEGMPMAIIEAQSTGVIPIVAISATTSQMITEGFDGIMYDAGNIESLTNVVTAFETKTIEELNSMSKNARTKFLNNYSEDSHIKKITEIYNA